MRKNKTVGGVWAQENLYPGLRTNNLRGGIDFTDLPMHDGFGVPAGSHIPGEVMHEYFKQYAQKWDILRRIDFETFVSEISRLEGPEGWNVKVQKGDVAHDLQTKKLIIATGITHTPHRPSIAGAKYFEAPIIHSAELGQRSGIITKDPQIKTVAVLGGAKSAYDVVYLSALAGKQVEWIVRKSGKGPCWVFPALATPLKAHREVGDNLVLCRRC
jgi:cation diffusion facilitator CzcD-associated flavoprotein CzcO